MIVFVVLVLILFFGLEDYKFVYVLENNMRFICLG